MKKFQRLKEFWQIEHFLVTDSLNGLFNRPFFKKKTNLIAAVMIVAGLYLAYFYFNMVELNKLDYESTGRSASDLNYIVKTTLSSLFNGIVIFSVIIFSLVRSTLVLSRNSLFFLKILPFKSHAIGLAVRIFRSSIGMLLLEALLIIVAPILKLLNLPVFTAFIALVSFHLVFLFIFDFLDFVADLINLLPINIRQFVIGLFNVFIVSLAAVHFFSTRFVIDQIFAKSSISSNTLIYFIFIVTLVATLTLSALRYIANIKTVGSYKRIFVNLKLPFVPLKPFFLSTYATLRLKIFWKFVFVSMFISIITMFYTGITGFYGSLLILLPLVNVAWIQYSSVLMDFRKIFLLLRVKPYTELGGLIMITTLISMPVLFIDVSLNASFSTFLFAVGISWIAAIVGFIFPKSAGNVNETVASVMAIILIVTLYVVINLKLLIYPALLFLVTSLYFLIKKETEPSK